MHFKRISYISAFVLLGGLFQLFVHGLVEMWYIQLLVTNYPAYSFGLSWDDWYLIHDIAALVLVIAGPAVGYWQGRYWWRQIYVLHRWKKILKVV